MSNNKCNLHLYLGKKDYEILNWKQSIPPRCFKFYIEQILLSYINGYPIALPSCKNFRNSVELKTKPIHIVLENDQIIDFLSKLDNGQKSKVIKEIILYYIRESESKYYVNNGNKSKKSKTPKPSVSVKTSNIKKESTNVVIDVSAQTKDKSIVETVTKNTTIFVDEAVQQKETVAETIQEPKINDKKVIKAPINTESKPQEKKNNPMMQALFKMSGDE